MNEKDWDGCLSENSAIKTSIDIKKINSLIKTSEGRVKFLEKQKIDAEIINYIFEGNYSSIAEILHAIAVKKGFKILNHICLGYLLRDILKREDLFRIFDDLRYKRNSLVYYGREMDFETAKEAIRKCKTFIKEIKMFLI